MNTLDQPATKRDVEEIVHRVVGDVVGGIVGDALELIAEQFSKTNQRMDKRFDKHDTQINEIKTTLKSMQGDVKRLNHTTLRIDNKLDAFNVVQEDHGMRIKKLEEKASLACLL